MNNESTSHPVWDVYDEHRTARLNVKYHSSLLHKYQSRNFVIEMVLAITAPSSAVAGLWFWDTQYGGYAWKILAVIAAVVAVIKPLLKYVEKIGGLEQILTGYRALDHDLKSLSISIRQDQVYNDKHKRVLHTCLKKKGDLIQRNPFLTEDKNLKKGCQNEVLSELPLDAFYLPLDKEESNE